MKKDTIYKIFSRLNANNPSPKIELNYLNKFTLTIAVLLSAQSTDIGVNKATKGLFQVASTPEEILNLGEIMLKEHIKTIGLHNNKARNIIALSGKLIADNINENIPNDFNYLLSLPGIGRKSANVILNVLFDEKTVAVDTHVFRVSNRIGLVRTNNPLQTEKKLLKVIPDEFLLYGHHMLVLHGRYICKSINPLCKKCTISDLCNFENKRL